MACAAAFSFLLETPVAITETTISIDPCFPWHEEAKGIHCSVVNDDATYFEVAI
jgi:hypothetical protein